MTFAQAASLPNVLYAAWNALFFPRYNVALQPGKTVLVHGAGGGIGSLVVQLAKWKGAKVIAVASSKHEAFLKELGVDEFIDYTQNNFDEVLGRRVDIVIDTICAEPAEKSYKVMNKKGIYVSLLKQPDPLVAKSYSVRALLAIASDSYAFIPEIESLVAKGIIKPVVSKTIAMTDIPKALQQLKTGNTQGKIVALL